MAEWKPETKIFLPNTYEEWKARIKYIKDVIRDVFITYNLIDEVEEDKEVNTVKLDFYLPKYRVAIECQGEQHFHPVKFFGGEEKYFLQKAWDERKKKICFENNVALLYYTSKKNFVKYSTQTQKNTFHSAEDLIKEIEKRTP